MNGEIDNVFDQHEALWLLSSPAFFSFFFYYNVSV